MIAGFVHLAIYEPPKAGLPYLVAAVYSDGKVQAVQAQSKEAAQLIYEKIEGETSAGQRQEAHAPRT